MLPLLLPAQVNTNTPNLSFEIGSFQNWERYTGYYYYNPTLDVFNYGPWAKSIGANNRFVIGSNANDPIVYCDLKNSPLNTNAARIGEPRQTEMASAAQQGAAAEKLVYRFKVTNNTTLFSYNLAAILKAPNDDKHAGDQRPNYQMDLQIKDSNGDTYFLPCSSYSTKADFANPQLIRNKTKVLCPSSSATKPDDYVYQPWMSGNIDLSSHVGDSVIVTIINHDCLYDYGLIDGIKGGTHESYGYFWAQTRKIELESFSCENSDATIVAPQGFSSYIWTRSDGKPITVPNPAQPYIVTIEKSQNVEGIVYTCEMNDANSSCGAINVSTTITPVKLYPDFTNAAIDAGKIQFTDASTATGDSITNYYWDFGDGSFSALKNPIHEYYDFIPFNVKLTVTSSKGCTKVISHNVLPTKELIASITPPANLQYNGQTKDFAVTTNISGLQLNIDYYIRYTNLPGTPFYNSYSAPAAAGSYNATFELSFVNLLKYYLTIIPSKDFIVTKAPLTVTVSDVTKTYGEQINLQREAFTQSMKPLFAGDKIYELNVSCSGLGQSAVVNTYPIVADQAIGLGVDNYDIQFVAGTLTVQPKPLEIKAINATKTYGEIISSTGKEFYIAPNSFVGSDSVASVNLLCIGYTELAVVADYSITVQNALGNRLSNYAISYIPATLQVIKKKITVTANALTKTYGTVYTFSGKEYSLNVAQLIGNDSVSSVQFSSAASVMTASVADYTLSITGILGYRMDNYDIKWVNNTFKVLPMPVTIIANNIEKEYGTLLNISQNEFTTNKALVTGDIITFVLLKSTGTQASAPIGEYDIVASNAFGVGSLNYDFSYQLGKLTIVRKKITADIFPPANLIYNGQNKDFSTIISISGLVLYSDYVIRYTSTDNSYNSTTAPVVVGNYTATFELMGQALLNYYTESTISKNFSIAKATVTLTANNAVKTYGDNLVLLNDAFKSDLNPLYGSDKIATLDVSCDGLIDTALVGPYPIVPIKATGSGMENYNFSFVNGSLTVSVKTLRIQALDLSKTYGDVFVPVGNEFYVDPNSLVGNDTVKTVTLASAGFVPTAISGTHPITVSNAAGVGLANYQILYTNSSLFVTKKTLTVTAKTLTKVYGTTYTFTGQEFVADKTAYVGTDSIRTVQLSSNATQLKAQVGDHLLTMLNVEGVGLENYTIKMVNAVFRINPMAVTITANNIQKEFGSLTTFNGDEFTLDKPLITGDTILYIVLKSAGSAALATVGDYSILPSMAFGTGAINYDFSYMPGTLKVIKKALTATLIPPTYLGYNGQTKDFSAVLNINGLVQNTDYFIRYTNLNDPTKFSYIAPAIVGDYKATFELNFTSTFNYSITDIPWQDFSISKAPLTVTATNLTKTYGENTILISNAFTTDMKPLFGSDLIFSVQFDCAGLADTAQVGNYSIRPVKVLGNGIENYALTYVDGSLTVLPKTITVRGTDTAKMYGETMSANGKSFNIDVRAMVGNDTITLVTQTSDGLAATAIVGNYALKLSNATGRRLHNYNINYSDGLLQVYKKSLIVQADSLHKTYGTEFIFKGTEFLVDNTQLVGIDKVNSVKINSQGAQKRASVGEYILAVTDVSGFGLENYDVKMQSNVFEVTPRELVVIASNNEKGYGDVLSFNGSEFTIDRPMVNNDTISFVFLQSIGSAATAAIGNYDIVPAQAFGNGSLNYNISYRKGTLAVSQKMLIVTAGAYEKEYGQNDPDVYFTVRDSRGVNYLPTLFTGKTQREAGEKPGKYIIKKGTLAINTNYGFNFTEGDLTIRKALPYIDPSYANDIEQTIVTDVIGVQNGDIPTGIVNVTIQDTSINSSCTVLNGISRNGVAELPDHKVVAKIEYAGDANYLPVTQLLNIYAIRYHTNGGDLNSPITHFDGSESVKLESPTHQENYRFVGWYEMPDFSGEPLRRIAFGTTRDVDLYAKWVTTFSDLSIVVLFNQVLAVANPLNREFIYKASFKWSKDGVLLIGNKQYIGFDKYVPTGDYKVEIYYEGITPIVLELKHSAVISKSSAYPNPVRKSASLTIQSELVTKKDVIMEVYNDAGKRVTTLNIEKQTDVYQLNGFQNAGVYLIRLIENGQVVEKHKVIVED